MSPDPYGFPDHVPPPRPHRSSEGRLLAAVQVMLLGLSALCCGTGATWLMSFADPADPLDVNVLVFLFFAAPAFPLAGAALATVLLRSTVQRWWAVAGPNLLVGAGFGCLAWLVVSLAIFVLAVLREL